MSREIRARSYDKELKKFFYFKNGKYYADSAYKKCISERICSEFDWCNVELFTGLKDKNGVEIYESDIIVIVYTELEKEFPMIVEYEVEDGAFRLNDYRYTFGTKKQALYYQLPVNVQYQDKLEVVGNIYENADLLK